MEVLDFTDKKFQEIPEQDNPAFGIHECFMVCRSQDYTIEKRRFIVLKIEPIENPKENESVTRIAEFWDSVLALDFVDAYVSQNGL